MARRLSIAPELSLAYIGTDASKKLGDELCAYPRRFRLGGKKEAAGVCRGRGEPMEFQSQTADTERVITLLDKADDAILSGPWPQYMAQCSVRGACGFVLVVYLVVTLWSTLAVNRGYSGQGLEKVPASRYAKINQCSAMLA